MKGTEEIRCHLNTIFLYFPVWNLITWNFRSWSLIGCSLLVCSATLSRRGQVTHISVSKLGHHWSRYKLQPNIITYWLFACLAPNHYLNQSWVAVNCVNLPLILFRPQCVKILQKPIVLYIPGNMHIVCSAVFCFAFMRYLYPYLPGLPQNWPHDYDCLSTGELTQKDIGHMDNNETTRIGDVNHLHGSWETLYVVVYLADGPTTFLRLFHAL